MTILNQLNVWHVTKENDWALWWISTDMRNLTWDISSAAANALMPAKIAIENAAHLLSNPFDDILNPNAKNGSYKKILPFVWSTLASSITKALKLPFATIEKAIEYGINNNVERWIESLKWISTKLIANILTDNWQWKSKILNWLWWVSEGIWDAAWTILKAIPWLLWEASKLPNHWIKWYWLNALDEKATNWLRTTQIDPNKNFISPKLINTADITNNSGYTPEKKDFQ